MPTYEPFDWYETPLYYDMVFDEDTEREVNFLIEVLKRYGATKGKRVLEPACGSGRLLAGMTQRGYSVTGFDLSEGMLSFARNRLKEHGYKGKIMRGDMADFSFPGKFDLAHCLVSTFKFLSDEASARNHLNCIARTLKPGGLYVLGLHLSDYEDQTRSRERWVARRGAIEVVCNIQGWPPDPRKRRERVRSRLVVTENGIIKRFETQWTFRTYSCRQLASLIKSVPELELVANYNFKYEIDRPIPLDGEYMDNVLILKRK